MAERGPGGSEVVIFYGPPCIGKTHFYHEKLAGTHRRISPCELWSKDPNITIRQIINRYVVTGLKEAGNIVLDDRFESSKTRQSYLSLIGAKVPEASFKCLKFQPLYGQWQLNLAREYSIAHSVLIGKPKAIQSIDEWFAIEEPPSEDEGFGIEIITRGLKLYSAYLLENPALIIQWEGMVKYSDGTADIVSGVHKTISTWYSANPCGRVIIVLDPSSTSGVTGAEREAQMKYILFELVKEVSDCPVFAVAIEEAGEKFSRPPNPGVLAFLETLHCLDFRFMGSLMLYHSPPFMKMAEQMGLRYMKAGKAFANPNLILISHAHTVPLVPEVHKTMEILSDSLSAEYQPLVPLVHMAKAKAHVYYSQNLDGGRLLYVCAKEKSVLERYTDLYQNHATLVSSGNSSQIRAMSKLVTQQLSSLRKTPPIKKQKSVSRGLPKWMSEKSNPTKKKTELKKIPLQLLTLDSSSIETESPAKRRKKGKDKAKTVRSVDYMLDEQELLEAAKKIWQQAGRQLPSEAEIEQRQARPSASLRTLPIESTSAGETSQQAPRKDKKAEASKKTVPVGKSTESDSSSDSEVLQDLLKFSSKSRQSRSSPLSPDPAKPRKITAVEKSAGDGWDILDMFVPNTSSNPSSSGKSQKSQSSRTTQMDSYVSETDSQRSSIGKIKRSPAQSRLAMTHSPDDTVIIDSFFDSFHNTDQTSKKAKTINFAVPQLPPVSRNSSHSSKLSKSSVSRVSDSIVSETNSSSKSILSHRAVSSPTSQVADSFVPESSSSTGRRLSNRSGLSVRTVPDSLVLESKSSRGTLSSSKSGGSRRTIQDSLVLGTSSASIKAGSSGKSYGSRHSIADSYVPDTDSLTSIRSPVSVGSKTSISDSIVSKTGSDFSGPKNPCSSPQNKYVTDSLVRNTGSSQHSNQRKSPRNSGPSEISDGLVPNTPSSGHQASTVLSSSSSKKKSIQDHSDSPPSPEPDQALLDLFRL